MSKLTEVFHGPAARRREDPPRRPSTARPKPPREAAPPRPISRSLANMYLTFLRSTILELEGRSSRYLVDAGPPEPPPPAGPILWTPPATPPALAQQKVDPGAKPREEKALWSAPLRRPDGPIAAVERRTASLALPSIVQGWIESDEEGWRWLAESLALRGREVGQKTIVIAGREPGDGATSAAIALAVSIAHQGTSVLLAEGNLEQPSLSGLLGLDAKYGLVDVVVEGRAAGSVLHAFDRPALCVAPLGAAPEFPHLLAGHPRWPEVFGALARRFEMVIVDGGVLGKGLLGRPARQGPPTTPSIFDAMLLVQQPGAPADLASSCIPMPPLLGIIENDGARGD